MFVNQPLSCDYASEEILSGEYDEVILTDSEDPVLVSFSIRETVTHVEITSMVLTEEGMEPAEVLHTQDELTPELPLVAHLEFPGDFSCYGLSFTDQYNVVHYYTISVSGKDGSLVAREYSIGKRCLQCDLTQPDVNFTSSSSYCDNCIGEMM